MEFQDPDMKAAYEDAQEKVSARRESTREYRLRRALEGLNPQDADMRDALEDAKQKVEAQESEPKSVRQRRLEALLKWSPNRQ